MASLPTLLLLLILSLAVATFRLEEADDKVLIELYYESLCPDCHDFIVKGLKRAANTHDLWKISDIKLYPYGNAKTITNGTSTTITCQHGIRECEGNMIEACAIADYDYYTKALPFVICLESNTSNWSIT